MGYSSDLALQEQEAQTSEAAYLTAERDYNTTKLFNAIFGDKKIRKISRQEAKNRYLYRRLGDSKLRLV